MVLIILSVVLTLKMGSLMSTKFNTWHFERLPVTYGFEEFAVSSNSEFCNEMARLLYNEDYSIEQIAVAMGLCLKLTEGFRDEEAGNGVAISADTNSSSCEESIDEQ
ncbi:hypothetical protein GCK32_018580, partial [Trichostrongylus colubriformis]